MSEEGLPEDSEPEVDLEEEEKAKLAARNQKKRKPGIIFLPTIPPYMTVMKLREILGDFGEIGRVFLQPDENTGKRKKNPALHFTEGWVEFKSKRIAKHVAKTLNNNRIGTRKKSKYYDHIWNIKYLPRFKWVHLSERLAYERAVHKQRMRTEVSQAKREAGHFQASVERSEKVRRLRRKQQLEEVMADEGYEVPQRLLDSEHRAKHPQDKQAQRTQILQALFGAK